MRTSPVRQFRGRTSPPRSPRAVARAAALAALLVAAALSLAGCDGVGATPTPQYTAVPIGATPWPNGTTGQYGLHIAPSLLTRLPKFVGAQPLVEDAEGEIQAMGNADLAQTFDSYAAAKAGDIGDDNWLSLVIGHLPPANQNDDFYSSWVDQYATAGCSQADGCRAQARRRSATSSSTRPRAAAARRSSRSIWTAGSSCRWSRTARSTRPPADQGHLLAAGGRRPAPHRAAAARPATEARA